MPEIHITTPCVINEITILPIPNNMSKKFTSRSQVMIKGMIGGVSFHGPAEPDGRGGHWIDATDLPSITANESVEINLQQSHDLPEPTMPHEFTDMLASSPTGKATWDKKTTPMAHWEWLRWTQSTKNPDTYAKRIHVSRDRPKKACAAPAASIAGHAP